LRLEAATHRTMMNNNAARSDTQRTDRDLDRIHRLQGWRALINVSHRCGPPATQARSCLAWLRYRGEFRADREERRRGGRPARLTARMKWKRHSRWNNARPLLLPDCRSADRELGMDDWRPSHEQQPATKGPATHDGITGSFR
jgi:hypothetical protein